MKIGWWTMAALPVLAAPGIPGDPHGANATPDGAPRGRLSRVADGQKDGQEEFDRDAWRKRLATSDLEERERACDELGGLARRQDEARKALEQWSKDEGDRELAWTSRMLLRELDRNPFRGRGARSNPGRDWLGSSFDFDDFSRRFEDLDSMFGNLRQEWGEMLHGLPAPSANGGSTSQSLSLQVGPDEVKCTVKENVDGKEETRTYTAKSMDELLEAHPELRANLGGTQFQFFQGSPQGAWQSFPRNSGPRIRAFGGSGNATMDGDPPLDRLGIYCADLEKGRAEELGYEAGVGLRVTQVQPGTIASLLGLRSGDIVVEVDGRTIRGTDDVKTALKERSADADVSVLVVGDDGNRRTLTWKPKPAPTKPEKKSGSRNL